MAGAWHGSSSNRASEYPLCMEILIVIAIAASAIIAWRVIKPRWEHRRWVARFRTPDERSVRKEMSARKELLRRFPDTDPSERDPIVKLVRDLEPGDLLRTARQGSGPIIVEQPTTTPEDIERLNLDYVVFTGFIAAIDEETPFLNVCPLDGYGTALFTMAPDEPVVAYVET